MSVLYLGAAPVTLFCAAAGGMFELVSGANFLGEIVEWCGYAVATCSLPSFAFAAFTVCSIGPRAYHHHRCVMLAKPVLAPVAMITVSLWSLAGTTCRGLRTTLVPEPPSFPSFSETLSQCIAPASIEVT